MTDSRALWPLVAALVMGTVMDPLEVVAAPVSRGARKAPPATSRKRPAAKPTVVALPTLAPEMIPEWLKLEIGTEQLRELSFVLPPRLWGRPITRGELAIAVEALLERARKDLLAADQRWLNVPKLTWREADPPHLVDVSASVRWAGTNLGDAEWVKKALSDRAASTAGRDIAGSEFKDVAGPFHQQQAITYLTQLGIFSGYPDQSFQENRSVSPAEFACVQHRVSQDIVRLKNGRCYLKKRSPGQPGAAGKPGPGAPETLQPREPVPLRRQ